MGSHDVAVIVVGQRVMEVKEDSIRSPVKRFAFDVACPVRHPGTRSCCIDRDTLAERRFPEVAVGIKEERH